MLFFKRTFALARGSFKVELSQFLPESSCKSRCAPAERSWNWICTAPLVLRACQCIQILRVLRYTLTRASERVNAPLALQIMHEHGAVRVCLQPAVGDWRTEQKTMSCVGHESVWQPLLMRRIASIKSTFRCGQKPPSKAADVHQPFVDAPLLRIFPPTWVECLFYKRVRAPHAANNNCAALRPPFIFRFARMRGAWPDATATMRNARAFFGTGELFYAVF